MRKIPRKLDTREGKPRMTLKLMNSPEIKQAPYFMFFANSLAILSFRNEVTNDGGGEPSADEVRCRT